jgi:hypothetical protein
MDTLLTLFAPAHAERHALRRGRAPVELPA